MERLPSACLPAVAGMVAIAMAGCGIVGGGNVTISVATDGNTTTLLAGLSLGVSATVLHAGSNPEVKWAITNCRGDCGTLNNTTTSSRVIYTAPQSVTAALSVTLTATAVADPSKTAAVRLLIEPLNCTSGSEALLTGQYAFVLQGSDTRFGIVARVGSFTADGMGGITGGQEDGLFPPSSTLAILSKGSSYSIGADHRSCLTLALSNGTTTRIRGAIGGIASGTATKARIIEFDDASGLETRAEGILRKQDPTAFTLNALQGNWVLGMTGMNASGGRFARLAVFGASHGLVSGGTMDSNDAGTVSAVGITGGIISIDPSGRGTIGFSLEDNTGFGIIMYVVSAQEIIYVSLPGPFPFGTGRMLLQKLSSFGLAALNANGVLHSSGLQTGSAGADVTIGLFMPDGSGSFHAVLDNNDAGTFSGQQSVAGSYRVSSNGRSTTTGLGSGSPVLYLINTNTGLLLGTSASVDFGFLEPQTGAPFSNATMSGLYAFGTASAGATMGTIASGSYSVDGLGSYTGTEDDSTPMGLRPGKALASTYAFLASAMVSGRGTLDSQSDTVAYLISPTKLVFTSSSATTPALTVVEK
jgi:hypothetical protein